MPNLSDKGIYLPPSPIRKLVPFAEAAKRRGIKVYHLNIGQPDIRTPQVAVDAVKNIHDQVFEYGHSAGNESYRRKLADYYRGVGIDVTTDDMVITVGGSEAIFMAMTICLNPGDEVLVPEPFYANYNGFAMEAGVNIKPISSTIANDFALPPMEEFERLITTRTKAILICNPNNPTGYVYSEQEYEQLKNIVLKHDLYLMADEVYREFCYDGTKCISVMNLKGVEQNVVMIDSVSKRYSMCGVRLGTLVSRNRRIIDAALKMGQARLCPPYLAQVAAEAALGAPRSYFEEVHDEYAARRNCMIEALNKLGGANGIGLADLVENRLVGMKSRGVYETPGGTILYKAHAVLETLCLDRDTQHYKELVAAKFAELVYYGQWFTPLREALSAFVDKTQEHVTGSVKLKLYKGNIINAGTTSPYSLYDPEIATFDEDHVYNQADAAGFINLFGLPVKVKAKADAKHTK